MEVRPLRTAHACSYVQSIFGSYDFRRSSFTLLQYVDNSLPASRWREARASPITFLRTHPARFSSSLLLVLVLCPLPIPVRACWWSLCSYDSSCNQALETDSVSLAPLFKLSVSLSRTRAVVQHNRQLQAFENATLGFERVTAVAPRLRWIGERQKDGQGSDHEQETSRRPPYVCRSSLCFCVILELIWSHSTFDGVQRPLRFV